MRAEVVNLEAAPFSMLERLAFEEKRRDINSTQIREGSPSELAKIALLVCQSYLVQSMQFSVCQQDFPPHVSICSPWPMNRTS